MLQKTPHFNPRRLGAKNMFRISFFLFLVACLNVYINPLRVKEQGFFFVFKLNNSRGEKINVFQNEMNPAYKFYMSCSNKQ